MVSNLGCICGGTIELVLFLLCTGGFGATWAWVRSKFKKQEKKSVIEHHKCCHPFDKHDET